MPSSSGRLPIRLHSLNWKAFLSPEFEDWERPARGLSQASAYGGWGDWHVHGNKTRDRCKETFLEFLCVVDRRGHSVEDSLEDLPCHGTLQLCFLCTQPSTHTEQLQEWSLQSLIVPPTNLRVAQSSSVKDSMRERSATLSDVLGDCALQTLSGERVFTGEWRRVTASFCYPTRCAANAHLGRPSGCLLQSGSLFRRPRSFDLVGQSFSQASDWFSCARYCGWIVYCLEMLHGRTYCNSSSSSSSSSSS